MDNDKKLLDLLHRYEVFAHENSDVNLHNMVSVAKSNIYFANKLKGDFEELIKHANDNIESQLVGLITYFTKKYGFSIGTYEYQQSNKFKKIDDYEAFKLASDICNEMGSDKEQE